MRAATLMAVVSKAGLVAALLAGCGTRGNLEYPAEAKVEPTATADSGQGKAEGAALKGHKPFILDGLIR